MLGSKAPTEYRGFSEEFDRKGLASTCKKLRPSHSLLPLISGREGAAGCGWSEEYREYRNGAPRSSKTKRGRKRGNNLYMIFQLPNTSGDS